jgi:hypothetical protein
MNTYLEGLRETLRLNRLATGAIEGTDDSGANNPATVEEEREKLDARTHRKSLVGAGQPTFDGLDVPPLSPTNPQYDNPPTRDDNFE